MSRSPHLIHPPRCGVRRSRALCCSLAVVVLTLAFAGLTPATAVANSEIWGLQPADNPDGNSIVDWDWRERGLAYIDLPLGLRAHFNASYSRNFYPSEDHAEALLRDRGPDLRGARALHSRIAVSRPLTEKIELEISCGTRNYFAGQEPMEFERYTIGAMIRIAP